MVFPAASLSHTCLTTLFCFNNVFRFTSYLIISYRGCSTASLKQLRRLHLNIVWCNTAFVVAQGVFNKFFQPSNWSIISIFVCLEYTSRPASFFHTSSSTAPKPNKVEVWEVLGYSSIHSSTWFIGKVNNPARYNFFSLAGELKHLRGNYNTALSF